MVIRRGEILWADLGVPRGSGPGYRRPVLVVQSDPFNRSRIATVVVAALSSNEALSAAPGNVALSREESGLPKDSVVNVSQVLTLGKEFLRDRVGSLPARALHRVEEGLRLVMGL
ncbi:MAG: type II toxin-antitoxin system PemK/MazF family toxin [Planctomycetes bacterium]|nr:type II toxin-antitoxin system PemK/MazF family toxin [Planctomycetota bacterium]